MQASEDRKIRDISLIIKDLLKVIKVVSLYPENNPLPQSLRRSFAEKLESIIEDHGELTIDVRKDHLLYQNSTIFKDGSKEECLAGLFFENGITQFTLKDGLEVEEIYKLLDAIKTYANAPGQTHDLAALIWEANLSRVSFRTVEDVALSHYDSGFNIQEYMSRDESEEYKHGVFGTDGAERYQSIFNPLEDSEKFVRSDGDDSERLESGAVESDSDPGVQRGSIFSTGDSVGIPGPAAQYDNRQEAALNTAQSAMGFDDLPAAPRNVPDSTLILNDEFKLSEEEETDIRSLIAEDADFDMYQSTLDLLQEILLQESELPAFSESVTICEKVLNEFVQAARLTEAREVLQLFKRFEERISKQKPSWSQRLKDAVTAAGSRDRLYILAEALNQNENTGTTELKKYLESFGWEALSGITDLMGLMKHPHHKECLANYLAERGKNYIHIVAKGIFDKRTDVVCHAISVLSHIRDDKVLSYLSKTVNHTDNAVRLTLVMSLKNCADDNVLALLRKMVLDPDFEIRREAVSAIVARRSQEAFDTIAEIVDDEGFEALGSDDQQSLLNAYSVLGGDKAVGRLVEVIRRYNHFHDGTLTFLRKAAFEALSQNRSEKCEKSLLRLARSWRPDIKKQAEAAIKRRRELIYGGE